MAFVLFAAAAALIAGAGARRLRRDGALRGRFRVAFVGVAAGAAGGLALGVALRIAMRTAALLGGRRELTVGGTLALVLGPAIGLAVFGVPVAGARRFVRAKSRGFVVVTALALLAFPGVPFLLSGGELDTEGIAWVNRLTFGAAIFAWGATMASVTDLLDLRLPGRRIRDRGDERGKGAPTGTAHE